MTKYKKIKREDQEKLDNLKRIFDQTILIGKQELQLEQFHSLEESETLKINDTFTLIGKKYNFVIYDRDNEKQAKIVKEIQETCEKLSKEARDIKVKYGYENVRSMGAPKVDDLIFNGKKLVITLSVNQTKKIRPFQEEKIQEWIEKNYKGFGEFWEMMDEHDMTEFCGFSYIANDIRVKLKGEDEKQFSLNNGVFFGVSRDQEVVLNIRVNKANSVKRQDYLGDTRTFFTITNDQKKSLDIYAKNESDKVQYMLDMLSKMYDMKFEE